MKCLKVAVAHAGVLVFVMSVLMLSAVYFWSIELVSLFHASLWVLIPALMVGSIYVALERPLQLKDRSRSDISLVTLYFEYILMFAGIYAISSVLSYGETIANHSCIPKELMTKDGFIAKTYFSRLILVYIDAIYFSVSTATTVGFGDMHAKNPLVKLFVVIQVLSCLYFVVLGAGYYFNRGSEEMNNKTHHGDR